MTKIRRPPKPPDGAYDPKMTEREALEIVKRLRREGRLPDPVELFAALEEIHPAKTSIYSLKLRVAELEQENQELRREIEELKQRITTYEVKWGPKPES